MKQSYYIRLSFLFLIITFAVIVIYSDSFHIFNYPPSSVHQWRQSDCAAYIKTYYHSGNSLLQPATLNLAGNDGRVASEFPILYYTAAKIQHIAGEHYWIIRGIDFLCYLSGLFALLILIRKWISNLIIAMALVIIFATSPYYYYYAINFLPNVPAISISFIGLYFFLQYDKTRKLSDLIIGTLLFVFSTALKPTDGGIVWLAFIGAKLSQIIFYRNTTESFKKITPFLISSLIIAITIIGWMQYVNWYNDQNGNHQNLIGILPFWIISNQEIHDTFDRMWHEWSNVYQQKIVLALWCITLLIFFIRWKNLDRFLKLFTAYILLGTLLYSALWFVAYFHHDYYQLPFVLAGIFIPVTALEYLLRTRLIQNSQPAKYTLMFIFLIAATISIYHNKNIQQERYDEAHRYGYINPAVFELEPYLNKIGVTRNEKVICAPDPSSNISLNAIGRYGFTEVYIDSTFNKRTFNIEKFKSKGANFLILLDSSYFHNPIFEPYVNKKIGEYKGIYVYDLR